MPNARGRLSDKDLQTLKKKAPRRKGRPSERDMEVLRSSVPKLRNNKVKGYPL